MKGFRNQVILKDKNKNYGELDCRRDLNKGDHCIKYTLHKKITQSEDMWKKCINYKIVNSMKNCKQNDRNVKFCKNSAYINLSILSRDSFSFPFLANIAIQTWKYPSIIFFVSLDYST